MVELVDGLVAEPRAGVGRLPAAGATAAARRSPACPRRDARDRRRPVGRAAAAVAAASRGDRVMLVDERHRVDEPPDGVDRHCRRHDGPWHLRRRLRRGARAARRPRSALARPGGQRDPRDRRDRAPIAFAGNDRPGVMLASAAAAYVDRFGRVPATRVRPSRPRMKRGSTSPRTSSARAGVDVPRRSGVERMAPPDARSRRTDSLVCVSRWRGTRTSRSGERSVAASDTTIDGLVSGPAKALPGSKSWGRRAETACPPSTPVGSSIGDTRQHVRRSAAGPDRRRHRRGPRCGAHVRGARETRDVHRDRDRSGQDERRPRRRDREPAARRRSRRAGTDERPAARDLPVSYAAIAGADRGTCSIRSAGRAIHPWHEEHGAVFEDVGQWKRPRYFPRDGEDMDAAVARECLAVRERGRHAGRLHPREDRGGRAGCGRLPRPDVHEPDEHARRRLDPLRVHARARRHGGRRRGGDAPRGGSLLRHDDHRERRDGPGSLRGVAPDRVAGAPRLLHERHRAVGRRRDRGPEGARRPRRARDRPRPRRPTPSRS